MRIIKGERVPSQADLCGWVLNDEGLYRWCLTEERGYSQAQVLRFVKRNRQAVHEYVRKQLNAKPR